MKNEKLKTKNLKPNLKSKILSRVKSRDITYKSSRVLVGLSGGVDSSVAAAILKKQNYNVIGVFLKFWSDPKCNTKKENACCNYESLLAARSVANKLKIPFYVFDVGKDFKKQVVDYFVSEYDKGRTPNPCVVCNKKIKFGWMLEQAKKLDCQFIAAGHYARIKYSSVPSQKDVRFFHGAQASGKRLQPTFCDCAYSLFQAKDKNKDQSYFLWQLNQEQLSHILFPIGDYTKEEVRRMARKWHLPSAEKKESQDLCFINTDKADFLANYADKSNQLGDIVDLDGNVLGKHQGLCYYTVGQRQGLGVQLKTKNEKLKTKNLKLNHKSSIINHKSQISSFQPAYVLKLNIEKNQLIVGSQVDLNSFELVAEKVNWIKLSNKVIDCQAKIRYGSALQHCHIITPCLPAGRLSQSKVRVIFDKPQRAITPGQSIVFFNKKEIIGGGIIL